jgi:hypothetical protein
MMIYHRDEWTRDYRAFLLRCDREENARREAKIRLETYRMNEPNPLKPQRDPTGKRLLTDEWMVWAAQLHRLEHDYWKMP